MTSMSKVILAQEYKDFLNNFKQYIDLGTISRRNKRLDNVRVLIRQLIEHCWIFNGIFPGLLHHPPHRGHIVQLVKVTSGEQPGHYLTFHSRLSWHILIISVIRPCHRA